MPSRMTTSARPCDSPAVRNRTMRSLIVYEETAALRPRRRQNAGHSPRTDSCTPWLAKPPHAARGSLPSLLRLLDGSGHCSCGDRRDSRGWIEAHSDCLGGTLRDVVDAAPSAAQPADRLRRRQRHVALRNLRSAPATRRLTVDCPPDRHAWHALSPRPRHHAPFVPRRLAAAGGEGETWNREHGRAANRARAAAAPRDRRAERAGYDSGRPGNDDGS